MNDSKDCNWTRAVAICTLPCETSYFELDKTIFESTLCRPGVGIVLVVFATIAGFLTLFLNILLIWSNNRRKQFDKLTPMDHFRSSLAVCGIFYGFSIIFSYIPSVAWTFNQSLATLVEAHLKLTNSIIDHVMLMYVTLTFTSTIYHLILLSILRFYAVTKVFAFKNLKHQNVIAAIIMVWVVSFVISFTIFFFPLQLGVGYHGNLMYSFYTIVDNENIGVGIIVYSFMILLLPCFIMSGFTLATYLKLRKELKKAAKITRSNQVIKIEKIKKERELFQYLIFLQVGSLTLFTPFFVVAALTFFNSDHDPLFFTFATYFTHCLGLMSVVVTIIRNSKFRADIKTFFCKLRGSLLLSEKENSKVSNNRDITVPETIPVEKSLGN